MLYRLRNIFLLVLLVVAFILGQNFDSTDPNVRILDLSKVKVVRPLEGPFSLKGLLNRVFPFGASPGSSQDQLGQSMTKNTQGVLLSPDTWREFADPELMKRLDKMFSTKLNFGGSGTTEGSAEGEGFNAPVDFELNTQQRIGKVYYGGPIKMKATYIFDKSSTEAAAYRNLTASNTLGVSYRSTSASHSYYVDHSISNAGTLGISYEPQRSISSVNMSMSW